MKKLSNAYMHETEFDREIECLMRAKHKNVVRFLGYCDDTQRSRERFDGKHVMAEIHQRLLCFEYVRKEGLDKYINGRTTWPLTFPFIFFVHILQIM